MSATAQTFALALGVVAAVTAAVVVGVATPADARREDTAADETAD